MILFRSSFFAFALFLFSCSEPVEKKVAFYDLSTKTSVIALPYEASEDLSEISGKGEILFPMKYVDATTSIEGNHIYLTYQIQWPSYATFFWKDFKKRLFLMPDDTLTIDTTSGKIKFSGESAPINTYLVAKTEAIGISDFISTKGILSSLAMDLKELQSNLDSLNTLELDFLAKNATSYGLPKWFTETERYEILYFSAFMKLNSLSYRERMLDFRESPPEGYFAFMDSLPMNNTEARYSVYYYAYLGQLNSHTFLNDSVYNLDAEERVSFVFSKALNSYDDSLDQPLRDYVYLYQLSKAVLNHYPLSPAFINEAVARIEDTSIQDHMISIQDEFIERSLEKGAKAPAFTLLNEGGDSLELIDFQGKVVLLSFWATWCRPCIKEIPFENQLNNELQGENFELVSICLGPSVEDWKGSLEKYQLKALNLYADKPWQNRLYDQYRIRGIPHYTLVDQNGNVIENKTYRASDGRLKELIDFALQARVN